jgi:ribonucleoside-diphosphate reductase alpha chain
MVLNDNQLAALNGRILMRNEHGEVTETVDELWERVAGALAVDQKEHDEFVEVMSKLEFLPNSPALANASTPFGQLAACFVLPVEDSIDGIMDSAHLAAKIHQTGGGTGFDFSQLRESGAIVRSTGNVASGPTSFVDIFDVTTGAIKQGGRRRGANMGILRVDHPDILDFIDTKRHRNAAGEIRTPANAAGFEPAQRRWTNFNVSVAITEEFLDALRHNRDYPLVSPRGHEVRRASAAQVWDRIAEGAWDTGDPGLFFVDRVNALDMASNLGRIAATNPCGEVPLRPYETCNLGSINLSALVVGQDTLNWTRLERIVRIGVRFLNRIIDNNKYPHPLIDAASKRSRKIGLGVMGFADMLIKLGIAYDSEAALVWARTLSKFINDTAYDESVRLAAVEGPFPGYEGSAYKEPIRNSSRTVIAPTGTLSIIADCSSGIEPLFSDSFVKNVMDTQLVVKHPLAGSKAFRKASDISPEWHVRMQAAWQENVDDSISKTINMAHDSTVDDIKAAYDLAIELGVKGLTVFRDGCLPSGQVLVAASSGMVAEVETCPDCNVEMIHQSGCSECPTCGLSLCSA